jgi:glycerophosphoryl diester phosphodiesterase
MAGPARPRIAAHRGGAGLWPENSLLAFRGAIAAGADLVELDLHLAADGGLAVIHDRTLERTTTGSGRVAEHPMAALRALRLKAAGGTLLDEGVPTLTEVLALVAPSATDLLIELKDPESEARYVRRGGVVTPRPVARYEGLEGRVLAALAAAGLTGRATVMAFTPDLLARVRGLAPGQATLLLVGRRDLRSARAAARESVEWARGVGAGAIGLDHVLLDAATVAAARAVGLAVGAWTVNAEADLRRLVDLGVDVITTDRPDVARRVLGG